MVSVSEGVAVTRRVAVGAGDTCVPRAVGVRLGVGKGAVGDTVAVSCAVVGVFVVGAAIVATAVVAGAGNGLPPQAETSMATRTTNTNTRKLDTARAPLRAAEYGLGHNRSTADSAEYTYPNRLGY
jgi:outer membrane murein-binding lipoprotein Lpp